jgi:ribonuclease G
VKHNKRKLKEGTKLKQIIVNCGYSGTRLAVIEEGKLVEFYVERPASERIVGNIYKGKVADVRPGIQAAFVDIGMDKNGYLYIDDCLTSAQREEGVKPNIRELVTKGQELLVQVSKEPFGEKSPRLTTQLSFPGRMLVYMPDDPYIGISRKIQSEEERDRLGTICKSLREGSEGVIVRTQAEGASGETLSADFLYLRGEWEKVKQMSKGAKTGSVVHAELALIPKLARDLLSAEVDEWVIDSFSEYNQIIKELERTHPHLLGKVKLYRERTSIFDAYGIETEIEKALKRKVWLKSGGYIVIDQTEALTAIDVNTGKFTGSHNHEDTVFKTNVEAAGEIARQLRLRDIGGIIIIDFIDMLKEEHKQTVYRKLGEQLKKDRTKSHLLGFTSLGLLEMTRKKVKQSIADRLMRICPTCEGKGKVMSEETIVARIERELKEYAINTDHEALLVEVHPHMEAAIKETYEALFERMMRDWGVKIYVRGSTQLQLDQYLLAFVGSEEEVQRRV